MSPTDVLLFTPAAAWRGRQVIALDWHDGPREGLSELVHPSSCVYFRTLAEQVWGGSFGVRLFALRRVADNAVEQYLAAYGLTRAPHEPCWAPHKPYQSNEEETRVTAALERILAGAVDTPVIVRSSDMLAVSEVWLALR